MMRTRDNSKFTLHKTDIYDWYNADEVDQRIAELEAERKSDQQELLDSIALNVSLSKENQHLRAERVSDEIIDDYIHIIKYGFGCRKLHRIGRDEAQAILDLRRANAKRDSQHV